MFLAVNRHGATITATLMVLGFGAQPAWASADGGPAAPTSSKIHAAVRRALRSRELWATVNICDTKRHPDVLGIRGQMPGLSFPSAMSMTVQVDYWSFKDSRFETDPGVNQTISLGDPANTIVQGGATFKFKPPVVLSGTITYEWKLGGKVIGHATKLTGHGYKHVAFGDPKGRSTATCTMN
jgi:hypothetical protein